MATVVELNCGPHSIASRTNGIELGRGAIAATYVLPIASHASQARVLGGYLKRLSRVVADVIVVDGSHQGVFDAHAEAWAAYVRHIPPTSRTTNGKVANVVTGVTAAHFDTVIVADDDVRYRKNEIQRIVDQLGEYEVVRPQNMFKPLPWHARWDTARSLLNRLSGGDWPGTLGVRKSALLTAGGYSGDVLFENLEMVRTVQAIGGREAVALDLLVLHRPPTVRHFVSQRTRQAYDEWARPIRFGAQLALLPLAVWLARAEGFRVLLILAAFSIGAAELGRRKGKGGTIFPPTSALWAPVWLAERALTAWIALFTRVLLGGVRYRNTRLKQAATPLRQLRQRVSRVSRKGRGLPEIGNIELQGLPHKNHAKH